jgi:hypothetical protein
MNWLVEHYQIILAIIIGVYEVIARVIPTVGDITIIGKIIALLRWLSDSTNRFKK